MRRTTVVKQKIHREMHTVQLAGKDAKSEKETIHSGQFMVSQFEAEEQDDEDNLAVPIPESIESKSSVPVKTFVTKSSVDEQQSSTNTQLAIETNLSKLFKCMTLAYRQKLTSPKWNRFRGIRLRWKDKIRLNNLIWRCWHLQFIKKQNTYICQFASPLDVDTHNNPEAIVLEGKYWKRQLEAVTAEYKKWRMYFRNHKDHVDMASGLDLLIGWNSGSSENMNMVVDEDYLGLMSDTLFSSITNQPFVFPDSREIARAGLADFIQPSLGPLQPDWDMMDTFDPLQELINNKLATVPEEPTSQDNYKNVNWGFIEEDTPTQVSAISDGQLCYTQLADPPQIEQSKPPMRDTGQTVIAHPTFEEIVMPQQQQYALEANYSVISKAPCSVMKEEVSTVQSKVVQQNVSSKPINSSVYHNFGHQMTANNLMLQKIQAVPVQESKSIQEQLAQQNQQQQQQIQELQAFQQQFKQPQITGDKAAYKFSTPSTPNIKFTPVSPQVSVPQLNVLQSYPQPSSSRIASSTEILEPRRRGAPRGRGRSRSSTRETIKRPPLLSAGSDPSLLNSTSSALLTQLLSNGSDSSVLFNRQTTCSILPNPMVNDKSGAVAILPQSSALITMPSHITVQPPTDSMLGTYRNSNSPVADNLHSPTSSQGSIGSPSQEGSPRDRRVGHIHAEHKRRIHIKNGFDMIQALIPHLHQNPNAKLSKAAMLQKGAEYIRQLRQERSQLKEEMDMLKQQIDSLNTSISNCQSLLPATGAPVSRRGDGKMQEMFNDYVRMRTMENWKFWIFSLIFRPLLNSFNNFVASSNLDDLYSSTMLWVEQHCTLVDLRPIVLTSLRYLCTKTDVLSEPEKLPEEARQMVLNEDGSGTTRSS